MKILLRFIFQAVPGTLSFEFACLNLILIKSTTFNSRPDRFTGKSFGFSQPIGSGKSSGFTQPTYFRPLNSFLDRYLAYITYGNDPRNYNYRGCTAPPRTFVQLVHPWDDLLLALNAQN